MTTVTTTVSTDGQEAAVYQTDPLSADTDNDGISDADEIEKGSDPGRLPGVAGVVGTGVFAEHVATMTDTDKDGLSDKFEKLVGTDHEKADSDGDGLTDVLEVSLGTDPTMLDTDLDGLSDGLEVRHDSNPLSMTVDAEGHAVETPTWTPEQAYADRQQAAQAAKSEQTDQQPADRPTRTRDGYDIERGRTIEGPACCRRPPPMSRTPIATV